MPYDRGAVVLIRFPLTDLQGSKQRPALIVSADRYHRRGEDVIVAAITSHRFEDPGPFDHPLTEWESYGLLHPSVVRAGKVVTLDRSMIGRPLGSMTKADLVAVEGKLKGALGLT